MGNLLAVFGTTLLLGALQDKKPEFKWDLKPDYVFDFKWTYQELKDQKRPTGQGNVSKASHQTFLDKRSIEAVVTVVEDPKAAGPLKLELTKVTWISTSRNTPSSSSTPPRRKRTRWPRGSG